MLLTRNNIYNARYREDNAKESLDAVLAREESFIGDIERIRDDGNVMPADGTKLDFEKVKFDVLAKKIANYLSNNFCAGRSIDRFDEKEILASYDDMVSMENKIKFPMGYEVVTYIIGQLREAEKSKTDTKNGEKIKRNVKNGDVKFERYVSNGMVRCNRLVEVLKDILFGCATARKSVAFRDVDTSMSVEIGGVSGSTTVDPYKRENDQLDLISKRMLEFVVGLYEDVIYPIQKRIIVAKENVFKRFVDIEDAVLMGNEQFLNAIDSELRTNKTDSSNRLVNLVSTGDFNLNDKMIDEIEIEVDKEIEDMNSLLEGVQNSLRDHFTSYKNNGEDPSYLLRIVDSRLNNTKRFVNGLSKIKTLLNRYKIENQTRSGGRATLSKNDESEGVVYIPASKLNGIFDCIISDYENYEASKHKIAPRNRILIYRGEEWMIKVKKDSGEINESLESVRKNNVKNRLTNETLSTDDQWYIAVANMFIDNYEQIAEEVKNTKTGRAEVSYKWVPKAKMTGYNFSVKNVYRFYDFINQMFGGRVDIGFDGQIKHVPAKDVLDAAMKSEKNYNLFLGPKNIRYVLSVMYKETFDRIKGLVTYQTKDRFVSFYGPYNPYGETPTPSAPPPLA